MTQTTPEARLVGNVVPGVSVIIPAHNRAHTLGRAIRSVLTQTFRNLELIVVDDASTDDTATFLRDVGDPRLRCIRHEQNLGVSQARNTGITAARAPYVAFLDSDDEWHPHKLARQIALMERQTADVGLVYTGYEHVERSGEVTEIIPNARGDVYQAMLKRHLVHAGSSTALVRRTCFENVGLFDERLAHLEDYDLWLRVAKEYLVELIPEVLARVHRDGGDHASHNLEGQEKAYRILATKSRRDLPLVEQWRTLANDLWGLGVRWLRQGDQVRARRLLRESVRRWPFSRRGWMYLFLAMLRRKDYLRLQSWWRWLHSARHRC